MAAAKGKPVNSRPIELPPPETPRRDIAEAIPAMADKDLATLRANAARLVATGNPKQNIEAARVLAVADVEIEKRRAAAPPRSRKASAAAKKT